MTVLKVDEREGIRAKSRMAVTLYPWKRDTLSIEVKGPQNRSSLLCHSQLQLQLGVNFCLFFGQN